MFGVDTQGLSVCSKNGERSGRWAKETVRWQSEHANRGGRGVYSRALKDLEGDLGKFGFYLGVDRMMQTFMKGILLPIVHKFMTSSLERA